MVKSTPAAETLALQEGSEHCYPLMAFLSDLVGQHEFPISIYMDIKSPAESVLSTNTLRDKCFKFILYGYGWSARNAGKRRN